MAWSPPELFATRCPARAPVEARRLSQARPGSIIGPRAGRNQHDRVLAPSGQSPFRIGGNPGVVRRSCTDAGRVLAAYGGDVTAGRPCHLHLLAADASRPAGPLSIADPTLHLEDKVAPCRTNCGGHGDLARRARPSAGRPALRRGCIRRLADTPGGNEGRALRGLIERQRGLVIAHQRLLDERLSAPRSSP